MSSITLSPSAVVSPASRASRVDWGHFVRVLLAAAVAAPLSNVVVYYLGDALIGYDEAFVELGSAIGIAVITLVPVLVAGLIYAGLLRYARNPVRAFNVVAAVVFVLTLIPDFTIAPADPGASNDQITVLIAMHTVAAAIIVPLLTAVRPRD